MSQDNSFNRDVDKYVHGRGDATSPDVIFPELVDPFAKGLFEMRQKFIDSGLDLEAYRTVKLLKRRFLFLNRGGK